MPAHIIEELKEKGVQQHVYTSLDAVIGSSDVLYVTRVQKERFASLEDYERLKHAFIITPELLAKAPAHTIVMHPLPRVGEITAEVDADPRAAYFRQMRYGLFVRMALIALLCGKQLSDLEAI
jgi:aspartate carbamoyltransferase catalytic subunit